MNEDIRELFEVDGKRMEAIKLISSDKLMVWNKGAKSTSLNWTGMAGMNEDVIGLIGLEDIDLDIIKAMKVWNHLSPETKAKLENKIRIVKDQTQELMAKARGARRKKYENIPREMTCITCGNIVEIVPGQVSKKCEKDGILLADYISGFKCKKCRPVAHRGKVRNPEFAKFARTMKCSCGAEVALNPTYLKTKAEKLGTTIEELVKNYKCNKCNPVKRGRQKTGNVAAKVELKCKCGASVSYPRSIAKKMAEKKGLTIEQYISSFECQKCHPTKGRPKKVSNNA